MLTWDTKWSDLGWQWTDYMLCTSGSEQSSWATYETRDLKNDNKWKNAPLGVNKYNKQAATPDKAFPASNSKGAVQ